MNTHSRSITFVLLALSMAVPALATELGDPAPALSISHWVKGPAVDMAKGKGKDVYVVEFWATWCGPCRTSIPHLSEVQQKFKDKGVTVVGISDETRGDVEPYVVKMGDRMDYTVALDKNRATYAKYMGAFGENGIPHAFVVDREGNIAWHGHPMAGLEGVLEQVVSGTYDVAAMKQVDEAQRLIPFYAELIVAGSDKKQADSLAEQILEKGKGSRDLMNQLAWGILTDPNIKYRNLDVALRAAKSAYDASGGKDANIVDTYARAFHDSGDVAQAIALQKTAVSLCRDAQLKGIFRETLEKYQREAGGS